MNLKLKDCVNKNCICERVYSPKYREGERFLNKQLKHLTKHNT